MNANRRGLGHLLRAYVLRPGFPSMMAIQDRIAAFQQAGVVNIREWCAIENWLTRIRPDKAREGKLERDQIFEFMTRP